MNASARSRCASAPSASTASRILHPPRQACDRTQQLRQEETIESDAWNRIKEYDRQHGVTETWSQVADASRRYSTQTGDSEMASLDESLSANLSRMRSFQERASLSLQESESWSEQAAQVRSDAQAIERELGQPFFAWLSERKGTDGHALGAAGAMRIASPQTAEDSEQLREYAAAFIAEKYPVPAGPDPASVGGAAEYEGAAGKLRGAYGRETAAAYGGWSAGVHDRAAAAGTPRPGETGAAAVRERAETETDLIMHDAARGARQTVTKQEIAEGGGPDGWRPGLCRQRQDLHAEPRRVLLEKRGYEVRGLAPSASAARNRLQLTDLG